MTNRTELGAQPSTPNWTRFYSVQRVRKTALALAKSISPTPDLLTVCSFRQEILWTQTLWMLSTLFTSMAASHGVDLVKDGRDQTIATIINNVSWSQQKKSSERSDNGLKHDTCVELHCVQDADSTPSVLLVPSVKLHIVFPILITWPKYPDHALRSLQVPPQSGKFITRIIRVSRFTSS